MAAKQPEIPFVRVFRPGAKVLLGTDIEAVVDEVIISGGNSVRYKVTWWNGRARCSEWLPDHEVGGLMKQECLRIGFHP